MIALKKKEKIFYKKYGYLIIKNVLNRKEILKLEKRLKYLERSQGNNKRGLAEPGISKSLIHSLHKDSVIKKIIYEKKWYKNVCRTLLEAENFIDWNCKSNLKTRWHGSAEYYHQDFEYWRSYGFNSSNMMSSMFFIDDHNHDNGGMWIFPKSHKKHYKHEKFLNINSLQKNLIPLKTLDKLHKKFKVMPLNEKAGSCIFFHCKLVHGSSHNISNNNRRIILSQISDAIGFDQKNIDKINTQNASERKKYEKRVLTERLGSLNLS
jgi:ectoine hydroxylase